MRQVDPSPERLRGGAAAPAAPAAGARADAWVEVWRARVHGMALSLTRERGAADDLGQEVLLRALRASQRPEGEALGAWLYRIARNAWIDGVRARAREPRGEPVERASTPSVPAVDEPPVLVAWKTLPEDERLVVWLRLMLDVPFREIALLLDTSKSAVDRTFRRALERLRKEFVP